MPLSKIADARKLSDEELAEQILATKRQLFQLRLEQALGKLEKTHQMKHARHKLSQLMMVEGERSQAVDPPVSAATSAASVEGEAIAEPAATVVDGEAATETESE